MAIQYIDQAEVKDQRVIARFDFNVPLNKETKEITDTSRIDLALPTIKHLLDAGVKKLVLMSHLGRPKGQVNKDFSLEPVATYLAEQLGQEVVLTESAIDNGIKELLTLKDIKIILLENLRFHEAETKNGEEFASKLASYADLYVNDAFGVSHRKHASVHAIHKFFNKKAYAGLLIKKEIEALDKVDHIISDDINGSPTQTEDITIEGNMMGLDIGPKTVDIYSNQILAAKTVLWNGPMGLFENQNFAKGTMAIAQSVADSSAFSVVGGGDSVSAVNKSGVSERLSHVSTGGGASLEYIEKGELVGIQALKFGV
jgi:3-phosphoglycerate kinase